MTKFCGKCRQTKPIEDFAKNKASADGINFFCRKCRPKDKKHWKKKRYPAGTHPKSLVKSGKKVDWRYFSHGITTDEYDALVAKQDGKCAICKRTPRRSLYIDHCHEKLVLRGLLCPPCNTALGMFRDSVEIMRAAIEYISRKEFDFAPRPSYRSLVRRL